MTETEFRENIHDILKKYEGMNVDKDMVQSVITTFYDHIKEHDLNWEIICDDQLNEPGDIQKGKYIIGIRSKGLPSLLINLKN